MPAADSVELQAFADQHIAPSANIRTDGWTGYAALKKRYPHLRQEASQKGLNFPLIHRQIMMIKAWLRGIHHHCKHLQAYWDEFNYRFKRLKHMDTIFHNLIVRMMEHPQQFIKN